MIKRQDNEALSWFNDDINSKRCLKNTLRNNKSLATSSCKTKKHYKYEDTKSHRKTFDKFSEIANKLMECPIQSKNFEINLPKRDRKSCKQFIKLWNYKYLLCYHHLYIFKTLLVFE